MKKSLLALAVAAALPAFAQAQTTVTLYGIADVAVEYIDFDQDGSGRSHDVRITNGVWSGSRVGLQGSEDLGGGMRGIFNFEHRLSPDTGTQTNNTVAGAGTTNNLVGSFWQQSYVGLAGGFGEIRLGRDYTTLFRAGQPGDVTGYSFYDNWSNAGFTSRASNLGQYITPRIAGMRIWAQYAAGETYPSGPQVYNPVAPAGGPTSNTRFGDMYGLGLVGNWGPVGAGLAYQDTKLNTGSNQEAMASIGAKFGPVGVGVAYWHLKPEVGEKTKGYYLSTSFAMGAGTLFLYGRRIESPVGPAAEGTLDTVGVAYTYALSKRTLPYIGAAYRKQSIDGPTTIAADAKPWAVALGLRHYF
jgi:predicted porin